MPGPILHKDAVVQCLHGGQAQATAPFPRVKVSSQMVVTFAAPHAITGCAFNVLGVPQPCLTATWTVAATRVKAGGVPVLLKSSAAICVPNGTGVQIVMTQPRVTAQ